MEHGWAELRTDSFGYADPEELADAIDNAGDQDRGTWLVGPDGRRIAALVPVEALECQLAALEASLHPPVPGR